MKAIVCADKDFGIGNNGRLLVRLRADMKHFREITDQTGKANVVIMGAKTYDEIGKPLPNRINIVLSRSRTFPNGVITDRSRDEVLSTLRMLKPDNVFVIGGQDIYEMFRHDIDHIYMTRLYKTFDHDRVFTLLDTNEFSVSSQTSVRTDNNVNYKFVEYHRVQVE